MFEISVLHKKLDLNLEKYNFDLIRNWYLMHLIFNLNSIWLLFTTDQELRTIAYRASTRGKTGWILINIKWLG